jgi:hypothetical protein
MMVARPANVSALYEFHRQRMKLPPSLSDDKAINTSVSVLYRVATCDDGASCRGGDHIVESLTARGINMATSAVLLCAAGLYDEALNSIRSLGEITNVFGFLWLYPERYEDWVSADRKQRKSEFSPFAIRKAIEAKEGFLPPMDKEAYEQLCEIATHVHGATAPNAYGEDGRRHVGGFVQAAGVMRVTEELSNVVVLLAMFASKMVHRDDLFEQVVETVRDT